VDGLWRGHELASAAALPAGAKPPAHPFNPFHSSSFGWGYILWQMMFQIAVVTTWQTTISRVLATKDEKTAKRMYTHTAFYFVGRFGLPGLWGAAAFVYFANHGGLPQGLDSLTAMPAYLNLVLPVGLIGLMIAAMLAAEMSTDSGYMLTWATVIYNDLIMPLVRRPFSQRSNLLITRGLVLGIGIFLLFFGLWYKLPGNAWDFLAVTGTIYLASVFTLLVAGLYWKRANTTGAVAL
jgi:SSS family solute:Na+ symporter